MEKQLRKKIDFLFSETLGRAFFILLKTSSGSYTIMCEIRAPPQPPTCQGGMDSGRERAGMVWKKTVREKCARHSTLEQRALRRKYNVVVEEERRE